MTRPVHYLYWHFIKKSFVGWAGRRAGKSVMMEATKATVCPISHVADFNP